jgi:hypothetical protein
MADPKEETAQPFDLSPELVEHLQNLCALYADALTVTHGELTDKLIDEIPAFVFNTVVELRVWPRPALEESDLPMFGYFQVADDDRQRFTALLDKTISFLRQDIAEDRTPSKIIEQYKEEHDMTWEALAEHLGISESHLRQRICNPNYTGSKRTTLQPIAEKLGCEWRELRWRTRPQAAAKE